MPTALRQVACRSSNSPLSPLAAESCGSTQQPASARTTAFGWCPSLASGSTWRVRADPSVHPRCYGWLRRPSHAGAFKRQTREAHWQFRVGCRIGLPNCRRSDPSKLTLDFDAALEVGRLTQSPATEFPRTLTCRKVGPIPGSLLEGMLRGAREGITIKIWQLVDTRPVREEKEARLLFLALFFPCRFRQDAP